MLHFHVASKYCKLNKITINSFQSFKNVCIYKDLVWHHVFTPSFISPHLLIDISSSLLHSQPESRVPQALLCSLFIFKGQIYLFLLFIGILSKYPHCLILISKVSLWEICQKCGKQSQKWEVYYVQNNLRMVHTHLYENLIVWIERKIICYL